MEQGLKRMRAEALSEIDIEACEASGGEIRGVCMFGIPDCVIPYSDAGDSCSDSSECEGRCVFDQSTINYDESPVVGQESKGICTADSDTCGCWWEIEDGVVQQGLCAD